MKPPSADESHWITMRPIPAVIVNVVADAPTFGHAETEVRPRPVPSEVSTIERAIAAAAPAKIAAQFTADSDVSVLTTKLSSGAICDRIIMINARSVREG